MQKEWQRKIARKWLVHIWLWLQTCRLNEIWVDNRTDFAGEFEKLCKAGGTHIYSTMSETKAAFAECTKRSLKKILYRYMEGFGYRYIHILSQFVIILNSIKNCSRDLIPKDIKNSDFLSILYSKSRWEYKNPKFIKGNRISKYNVRFKMEYEPPYTQKVIEIVGIFSRKSPTYTIKDEQYEIIRGKFYQKELIEVL